MKKMVSFYMLGPVVLLSWEFAIASDYLIVPVQGQQITSWDKKISGASRFQLVLDDEAVLDKETGLVWDRSLCSTHAAPEVCEHRWHEAAYYCHQLEVGGRMGWRLPTVEELATLMDKSQPPPKLPAGHPFYYVRPKYYWSLTTAYNSTIHRWGVHFSNGNIFPSHWSLDFGYVWCVRGGGYGRDG